MDEKVNPNNLETFSKEEINLMDREQLIIEITKHFGDEEFIGNWGKFNDSALKIWLYILVDFCKNPNLEFYQENLNAMKSILLES